MQSKTSRLNPITKKMQSMTKKMQSMNAIYDTDIGYYEKNLHSRTRFVPYSCLQNEARKQPKQTLWSDNVGKIQKHFFMHENSLFRKALISQQLLFLKRSF